MRRHTRKAYKHANSKGQTDEERETETADTPTEAFILPHAEPESFWKRLSNNLSYSKYLIIILFLPPILNFGALQREARLLLPQGQKVDMGWGQKMYIHCEGVGLPTVILDAPTGTSSDIWLFIQRKLAPLTQVCVYDRSGIGSSDPVLNELPVHYDFEKEKRFIAHPSTLSQMTSDLHHLLKGANLLKHPNVLVGSEVGSLIARMYSILYTKEVSDIVLVDPLVEIMFLEDSEWVDYWYSKLLPSFESLHLSAVLGISRIALLFGLLQPLFFKEQVPDEVMFRQKSLLCNPRHINTAFHEYLFMNTSFNQMSEAWLMKPFPKSVSVSVLSRDSPAEFPEDLHTMWTESRNFLIDVLHPNCQYRLISDAQFLEMYSLTSPILAQVHDIILRWRKRYGQLPAFDQ